jgi:hypothetical protein
MSYAEKTSLVTVLESLKQGKRELARMQLILTYCLWPSFKALGRVLGGTLLSFLPKNVIERTLYYIKEKRK